MLTVNGVRMRNEKYYDDLNNTESADKCLRLLDKWKNRKLKMIHKSGGT